MSTQPPDLVIPPAPPPGVVVHPPLPLGWGSAVSLTGIAGSIAAFLTAWGENHWHMTSPISVLGVAAAATVISFFQGRSHQFAAAVSAIKRDLAELGISVTPPIGPTPVPPPK
jgi:hypothetical protein